MGHRAPSVRWQRLGLMVLVSGLSAAGLALQSVPRPVDGPPPPAVSPPVRPAATAPTSPDVPAAPETPQTPAVAARAWPDVERTGDGPTVWAPAEPGPVVPDVAAALEPRVVDVDVRHPHAPPHDVHAIDSPRPRVEQAVALVVGGTGTGDGIEGFEPGMIYWFGPRGLQKIEDLGMEAQQ